MKTMQAQFSKNIQSDQAGELPGPANKEQLQERAQLVRVHEANCKIEYPTPDEANFRLAVMKKIGFQFRLKEVRPVRITGPVLNTPLPPTNRGGRSR
jgi:hypothetical protein